jgi:hypothetical protein
LFYFAAFSGSLLGLIPAFSRESVSALSGALAMASESLPIKYHHLICPFVPPMVKRGGNAILLLPQFQSEFDSYFCQRSNTEIYIDF